MFAQRFEQQLFALVSAGTFVDLASAIDGT